MREEERLTDNLTPDRTRLRDELQRMETTFLLTTPWTMLLSRQHDEGKNMVKTRAEVMTLTMSRMAESR
jgi:hypothetical protein